MLKVNALALLIVLSAAALFCASRFSPLLAQTAEKPGVLAQINLARIANGLPPFALNPALEKAAQFHSDDMAAKSFVDHTGSDGSSPLDRINAAGYPGWSSTHTWAENVYAGSHGFGEALGFFMSDDAQRRSLLSTKFREIGIGIATSTNASGIQTTYWTLSLGSQPNVLPIFINDGATLINVPQVAIHLTQEEAVPAGEGSAIGTAIEVRVSSDSTFKDAPWHKWEPLIPFTFEAKPGLKTVYVELRDAGGRTTISTASIQYDPNSTPQVTVVGPGGQITAVQALEPSPSPLPTIFATVAPMQTIQPELTTGPASKESPAPTVTPIILVVVPRGTQAANLQPTAQATPQTRPLMAQSDTNLIEWLLPAYLVMQALVILIAVLGFFKMKTRRQSVDNRELS